MTSRSDPQRAAMLERLNELGKQYDKATTHRERQRVAARMQGVVDFYD